MLEFISEDFANGFKGTGVAKASYDMVVDVIKGYMDSGKTANAVAEYMSYVLTNDKLATAAFDRKGNYAMAKATKAIISFIKGVLGIAPESTYLDNMLSSLEFHTLMLTDVDAKVNASPDMDILQQRSTRTANSTLLSNAITRLEQLENSLKKKVTA